MREKYQIRASEIGMQTAGEMKFPGALKFRENLGKHE